MEGNSKRKVYLKRHRNKPGIGFNSLLAAFHAAYNSSATPDDTNVVVSVTGRSERDLTKRFNELDIEWPVVENQLVQWSDLF